MSMVSDMKILDSVGVDVGGKVIYIAVEFDTETGLFKILGVEEYPENPMVVRKPVKKEELEAVRLLEEYLRDDPSRIHELYGRVISLELISATSF